MDRLNQRGFTLIELLIVIVVISILIKLALPYYQSYVRKSRRTDAMVTLSAIQLAQERYRYSHISYADLAQIWSGTLSPKGYYDLAVANVTGTGYTIIATAKSDQSRDTANGHDCSQLSIVVANGVATKLPAVCWQ